MTTTRVSDGALRETAVSDLVLAVSTVLELWDTLRLELGEVAVVTEGHPLSRLAALAATWYGALPVLFVTNDPTDFAPGVTSVLSTGSEKETRDLAGLMRETPGAAALELSGTAAMVDVLLEALPPASRLLLAGDSRERLTIDYYLNVHIKGLRLVSRVLDPQRSAQGDEASAARIERAIRLLERQAVAAACRNIVERW